MDITYDKAINEDIDELIRLRIAYMIDDFGSITDQEKQSLETQLSDYFARKLGTELIAFVARDDNRIISVAYLHIIEMPANLMLLNGKYGEVLSVYTEPDHRRRGLCTKLMKNLIEYGKSIGLGRIDLSATAEGYPIYAKIGFKDKELKYRDMCLKF